MRRPGQWRHARAGFTMVELVVTLAVAAILVAAAAPSLGEMLRNNRIATSTNELVAALQYARAEAIRRGRPVSLCSSSDGSTCAGATDWSGGWIAVQDGASSGAPVTSGPGAELVRVFDAEGQMAVTGPNAWLRFRSNGSVDFGGSASRSFDLVPTGCTGDQKRRVTMTLLGRVSTSKLGCS